MSPQPLTVARAVVAALEAEGVDRVFGMPGSHILSVFDALAESGIRFVPAVHENTSAFMAGMHGYLTGRPGVALLTAGPGATNSVTGVAQAYASSLPLVHITGDVPLHARREAFHGVDAPDFLHRLFRGITKASIRVERPDQIFGVMARAFALARSGRPGPVHVDLPIDLGRASLPDGATYAPQPVSPRRPSPAFVEQVVERLARAQRPMLCVCRGVLLQHAEAAVLELAEQLGAPVLSTGYGLGAFPQTHPLAVGTFSEFSKNAYAFELARHSDCLLLLGLRAGTLMTDLLAGLVSDEIPFAAFEDPEHVASWRGPFESCDVNALTGELLAHADRFRRAADPDLLASIRAQQRSFERGLAALLGEHPAGRSIHFGRVMQALAEQLPDDAIVVSGVGNHHVWARQFVPVRHRASFVAEAAWGTMGGELGGAIAASLLHPDRTVVAVTGDASLLMVAGDFATAVQERAHLVVLVLNDGHHGIIGEMQRQSFGRAFGHQLAEVDFAKLAGSMGGVGVHLVDGDRIGPTVARALAASRHGPVLLDVVADAKAPWPNRERLIERGRALGDEVYR